MKTILAVVAVAAIIASPAFAQGVFKYQPITPQEDGYVPGHPPLQNDASSASVFKYPSTAPTRGLYDVAPFAVRGINSNNPAVTGGGSSGYNANLYNY